MRACTAHSASHTAVDQGPWRGAAAVDDVALAVLPPPAENVRVTVQCMDADALKRALASVSTVGRCGLRRCGASQTAAEECSLGEASGPVSRIAAALEGAGDWCEEQDASRGRQTRHVVLRVKHRPAVAVRALPHTGAELLAYIRTDTVVAVEARQDAWARLHDLAHGRQYGGEAWVLLLHDEYGPLFEVLSGDLRALPTHQAVLASPQAAAAAEPCGARVRATGRRSYQVIHSPHVMVRAAPSLKAPPLGYKAERQLVVTDAEQGEWVRLAADEIKHLQLGPGGIVTEAWMLRVHPTLGPLLEHARSERSTQGGIETT